MLSSEAIAQINELLDLCDTYLLNQAEINFLDHIGEDPSTTCQYYETTQKVLEARATENASMNKSLNVLLALASNEGCELEPSEEFIPDVDVPFYGGGLSQ